MQKTNVICHAKSTDDNVQNGSQRAEGIKIKLIETMASSGINRKAVAEVV